jgi:hypothetical protein
LQGAVGRAVEQPLEGQQQVEAGDFLAAARAWRRKRRETRLLASARDLNVPAQGSGTRQDFDLHSPVSSGACSLRCFENA